MVPQRWYKGRVLGLMSTNQRRKKDLEASPIGLVDMAPLVLVPSLHRFLELSMTSPSCTHSSSTLYY